MYFYDALKQCNTELLTKKFLKLCVDSPTICRTETAFSKFLRRLLHTVPNLCSKAVIRLEQEEFSDAHYNAVYAEFENDPNRYGFERNPWADTLGYRADPKSIRVHGLEYFAALVLWQMTWFGFEEEAVRQERSQHE